MLQVQLLSTSFYAATPFARFAFPYAFRALVEAIEDAEKRAIMAEQALAREMRLRAEIEAELAKVKLELMQSQSTSQKGTRRSGLR